LATLPLWNGFFALAAHDRQAGMVYLIRDRFGVKPLLVARTGKAWAFASELDALYAAGLSARPHRAVLHRGLESFWSFGPDAPVQDVIDVPPGHLMEIDVNRGVGWLRSWVSVAALADADMQDALRRMPPPVRRRRLSETLDASVGRRLLSEVPVAALCSGGLDSGLITAMAARRHPGLQAFTLTYPGQPQWEESHYAEQVTKHAGVPLHRVRMDAACWRTHFVVTACRCHAPIWYESAVAGRALAAAVHASGARALLGGEGADEICGGYDFKFTEERSAFFREIGAPMVAPTVDASCWPADVDLSQVVGVAAPVASELDYRRKLEGEARQATAAMPPGRAALTAAHWVETRWHLYRSLQQVDAWSMSCGIEAREPFLDLEMVTLCMNLPLEAHVLPTIKGDLKEVAKEWLPAAVVGRTRKLGFSFDAHPFLAEMARPCFLAESMVRELFEVADPCRLTRYLEPGGGRGAFRLISLEIWLRHHLGRQSIEAIERALWKDACL
jgi:asparagine synthase (glutamine-hydrolysing)